TMRRPNGDVCTDLSCRVVSMSRSVLVRAHPPELFLAPSQSVIDAHAHLPWTEGRMRHVPHPLDQPAADHEVAVVTPGGKATFGYLGQLSEPKGIPTLLAAFASVVDDGHRLLVGGQGPMADALGRAGPSVQVLGWLDDSEKDRFFSRIHCLIVPSNYPETGPLVVLEARARGVPVIGSRLGGIPENVGPLCRSLLFTPGDAADLSNSIRRFVADPDRFAASPDTPAAEPVMSWPRHSAAIVAYYEEAISRRQFASSRRQQ
ncbi:MAG TPA: glycosyltransferase, partial [Acidimicrobiales bacterium]|nr:glycosyltransferase [Acidimicrobiales bacterium]